MAVWSTQESLLGPISRKGWPLPREVVAWQTKIAQNENLKSRPRNLWNVSSEPSLRHADSEMVTLLRVPLMYTQKQFGFPLIPFKKFDYGTLWCRAES